jgi:hypothetical protein
MHKICNKAAEILNLPSWSDSPETGRPCPVMAWLKMLKATLTEVSAEKDVL